jgi:hypothetical protein
LNSVIFTGREETSAATSVVAGVVTVADATGGSATLAAAFLAVLGAAVAAATGAVVEDADTLSVEVLVALTIVGYYI